eukprot:m.166269 g.166269  ORF g.166269 m.166269 type:complete len:114 (-) comp53143_c0_seq7:1326-1667(-)
MGTCGALNQEVACNTQACPIDCIVSEWSTYGPCSQSCGGGLQTQSRTVLTPAANGGAVCPPLANTRSCETSLCPVDCVLSNWANSGSCSKSCAEGFFALLHVLHARCCRKLIN